MTEEDFFAQALPLWRRRVNGYIKANSAGKDGGGDVEPFTQDDLSRMMADHPD